MTSHHALRPGLTAQEAADWRECQGEHDNLMGQLADREAQIEHGLIDDYTDYAFTWEGEDPRPEASRTLQHGRQESHGQGAGALSSLPYMATPLCSRLTKKGVPCVNGARPSGLCHIHDPEVQCRARNAKGAPCTVATGGGTCQTHAGRPQIPIEALQQTEALFGEHPGLGQDVAARGAAVEPDEEAQVPGPRLSLAFVARTYNLG
ncbi:hypothetical protein ACFXD5_19385 [Streptomyces sp. NPDC059385]|uniref:hypothetical protein n=1 Tax=Streptomyces sp. NPDC059385 TaxID=3346817 RepID=UPI0036851537